MSRTVEDQSEPINEGISPMPPESKKRRGELQQLLAIPGLWNQVYAAAALSLAGFLAGTVEGWPASITLEDLELSSSSGNVLVGPREIGIVCVLMVLSAMIHMMMTGALLDRFGRKAGCWFLNFLAPSGWVFLITTTSVYQFYLGATLIGTITISGANVGVIFLSEITNDKLRGPLISAFMFFNSLGKFASHILLTGIDFSTFHALCLAVNLLFPFLFWRLPESPAFLMKKSRGEDAKESVEWYHGNQPEVIESEMEKLNNAAQIRTDGCTTIFGDRSNRRALIIVVCLFILTELIGTSTVEVFAASSISMANGSWRVKAKSATSILASCRFIGGILNVYFVERSGRKSTLTLSLWFMSLFIGGVSLIFLSTKIRPLVPFEFSTHQVDMFLTVSSLIALVCLALYTLANQMCLGTIDILSVELLTADTKGAVMAIAGVSRVLTFAICVGSYYSVLGFDDSATWNFLIYCIFCVLGAVLGHRYVPETQGKTLNEIHSALDDADTAPPSPKEIRL